ncbi:hypothetical protein GEMRC1_011595 [Eukaryota sp. GEM-RC1]
MKNPLLQNQNDVRSGALLSDPTTYNTPAPVLLSQSGNLPGYIQRDNSLPSNFFSAFSYNYIWDKLDSNPGDLSLRQHYCHNYPIVLSVTDAISNDVDNVNDNCINLSSPAGRLKVSPKSLMDFVTLWKPDIAILPIDDSVLSLTDKRQSLAIKRSINWTEQYLSTTTQPSSLLFLTVSTLCLDSYTPSFIDNLEASSFKGVHLSSYDTAVSDQNSIRKLLGVLPQSFHRHVTCIGTPLELFHWMELGFDLISVSFHVLTAKQGLALTFLDSDCPFLNLLENEFVLDDKPISSACSCQCCKDHSRQYINHLLKCHEMLAESLLLIHNSTVVVRLFDEVRESISSGNYETYKNRIFNRINKIIY